MTEGKKRVIASLKRENVEVFFNKETIQNMDIKDIKPMSKILSSREEKEREVILKKLDGMEKEQIHTFRIELEKQETLQMSQKNVKDKPLSIKLSSMEEKEREVISKKLDEKEEFKFSVQKIKDVQRELKQPSYDILKEDLIKQRKKALEEQKIVKNIEEKQKIEQQQKEEKHMEVKQEKIVGIVVASELGAASITKATEIEEHNMEKSRENIDVKVDMDSAVTKSMDMEGNQEIEGMSRLDRLMNKAREDAKQNKENNSRFEHTREDVKQKGDEIVRERTTKWGNY